MILLNTVNVEERIPRGLNFLAVAGKIDGGSDVLVTPSIVGVSIYSYLPSYSTSMVSALNPHAPHKGLTLF